MVLGQAERLPLARASVRAFLRQGYSHKQLVIVNATPTPVLSHPVADVVERMTRPDSVGALRNLAVEAADGDWLCQWDDDDYHAPARLIVQMAYRRPGCCAFLSRHVVYDAAHRKACVQEDPNGARGTLLWPRGPWRFRTGGHWEDRLFVADHFPEAYVLQDADPLLHTAVWHGLNASTAEEFWGHEDVDSRPLSPDEVDRFQLANTAYARDAAAPL
jgi:hypothetical protein